MSPMRPSTRRSSQPLVALGGDVLGARLGLAEQRGELAPAACVEEQLAAGEERAARLLADAVVVLERAPARRRADELDHPQVGERADVVAHIADRLVDLDGELAGARGPL